MYKLKVKLLDPRAKTPTVANPSEDLAYDIYALEDTRLFRDTVTIVRTGIAAQAKLASNSLVESKRSGFFTRSIYVYEEKPMGLLIRDRSSMAAKGVFTHGGVIDAGYTGEIKVIMTDLNGGHFIKAGDKIAQILPVPVLTGDVEVVEELEESTRGGNGFGSSGR